LVEISDDESRVVLALLREKEKACEEARDRDRIRPKDGSA
jgi:hypothetical protein